MFLLPEQMPLSAGVVTAIAIAAILVVGIMTAGAYFIFIRRFVCMCVFCVGVLYTKESVEKKTPPTTENLISKGVTNISALILIYYIF